MSHFFIAIAPAGLSENQQLKQLIGKMKRTLNDQDRDVRWTAPDLWHVTVQFLGELSEARALDLLKVMQDWRPHVSNLHLRLSALGGFPSNDQARVLWVGVQESQELMDLQAQLGLYLGAAGFAPQAREYHPHLTLARWRNLNSVSELVGLGGRKHFGDYPVREFIVFQSVLQGNVIKYIPRLRVPLNDSDWAPLK